MKPNAIVVCSWPLSNGDYSTQLKDDPRLEKAIKKYAEGLPSTEEVFKYDKNIIVTDKECYGAFFAKDLKHVQQ